jgi:nitrate reductase cytochrome c-type subunit
MREKILFIGIVTAIFSLSLQATTNKEIKMEAKVAIMKLGKTLKGEVVKNMKANGPVSTAYFCYKNAEKLTKKVNATYKKGISVKRISLKNRDKNNYPSSKDEIAMLKKLSAQAKAGKKLPKLIVEKISDNHYKVYKPIFVGKKCIVCHGDAKHRSKEAYKIIKEKYPNDKAVGYKVGDFRGAFVANIIK